MKKVTDLKENECIQQFQWGEDVEVSDDGVNWRKMKFVGMNPVETDFPFIVVNENGGEGSWVHCVKPQSERAKIEAQIAELQEKLKNL